jgi:hypothetical protein
VQPHEEEEDAGLVFDPEEDREGTAAERVEAIEEEEAPAKLDENEIDVEQDPVHVASRYQHVLMAARAAMDGRELDEMLEQLPELGVEERAAVEVLARVARGTHEADDKVIYAEERLEMLNQALAVLQPALALGLAPELGELRDSFDELIEEVQELQEKLGRLEDAQEEMFAQDREVSAEAPDTDDKPKPPEADADDGAEKPSTLYGKPGDKPVEKPEVPTTLIGKPGDKPVEKAEVPTTLTGKPGDKPVEKPAAKSSVWDGD